MIRLLSSLYSIHDRSNGIYVHLHNMIHRECHHYKNSLLTRNKFVLLIYSTSHLLIEYRMDKIEFTNAD